MGMDGELAGFTGLQPITFKEAPMTRARKDLVTLAVEACA